MKICLKGHQEIVYDEEYGRGDCPLCSALKTIDIMSKQEDSYIREINMLDEEIEWLKRDIEKLKGVIV